VRVVAGLGNPGTTYQRTRHNIGFMVLNEFAARHVLQWERKRFREHLSRGSIRRQRIMLIKPQAYMNRSGDIIAPLLRKVHARPPDLVVIHDDIDVPFGRIKIRHGGGAGGHKGVLSIIGVLESQEFLRVKMGIGRPEHGEIDAYVLECFSEQECDLLPTFLDRGVRALECLLSEGVDMAMNRFNAKGEGACEGKGT